LSDDCLTAALRRGVSFNPYTLRLTVSDEVLSRFVSEDPHAYAFFYFAYSDPEGRLHNWHPLLDREPYSAARTNCVEPLSDQYRELDDRARLHVLAFETFLLHELTHLVDHLATPYGAMFQFRLCEEYLVLGPILEHLSSAQGPDLSVPLYRYRRAGGGAIDQTLAGAAALARSFWAAEKPVNARHVTMGWPGAASDVLRLLGQDLRLAVAAGTLDTVLVPGSPAHFPTPRAVIEARALANCMKHILGRFRDDAELAGGELVRYLNEYYHVSEVDPAYRFVLDLFARWYGYPHVEKVVAAQSTHANASYELLDRVPTFIQVTTWFALLGPDPVARLLVALKHLEDTADQGRRFDGVEDWIADLVGFEPEPTLNARLQAVAGYATALRERNDATNPHPALREHFDEVLARVQRQALRRRGEGTRPRLLVPPQGNLVTQDFIEHDADDLGGLYAGGPAVERWFNLREMLFFSALTSEHKRAEIATYLSQL
jgi:hypothetical protein